ncbi:DUF2064 domain-containing protein [Streptosporangium saharense]|uniref:DUF2064 domain-containing protein n=1 Tax=Streptosporangium saharense TaxID=1706840 RepID=UPI0033216870
MSPGDRTEDRLVAVVVTASMSAASPPGIDPRSFLTAVVEDTYELVSGLDFVTTALVTSVPGLEEIVWPGTPVLEIPELSGAHLVRAAVEALSVAAPYAGQVVLLSGDAPDLPPLLVGKLFRALGSASLAVCPAVEGGAVAIAARTPWPGWAEIGFDDPEPVRTLRGLAPTRTRVATGPGWHRLRAPADIHRLDPGLEGWDNTRALLSV